MTPRESLKGNTRRQPTDPSLDTIRYWINWIKDDSEQRETKVSTKESVSNVSPIPIYSRFEPETPALSLYIIRQTELFYASNAHVRAIPTYLFAF